MDALLFAINLEVLLLQMKILGTKLPEPNVNATQDKLIRIWRFIKDICQTTLLELVEQGRHYTLNETVHRLENNCTILQVLGEQSNTLKRLRSVESIKQKVTQCKQECIMEYEKCDTRIASLLDALKDCTLNTEAQLKYADKWLSARSESLEFQLPIKPSPLPVIEHEHYVHKELTRAYDLQIKEREDLLVYWDLKFAKDTQSIRERVAEKHEHLKIAVSRREGLEKLYETHEGEIRGWLTFKKERAARLEREERARKSATLIQAWWRSIMVQRCLGAFRFLKNTKKISSKPKKNK